MLLLMKRYESFRHSAVRPIARLSSSTYGIFGDSKRAVEELPKQHNQRDIYVSRRQNNGCFGCVNIVVTLTYRYCV